MIGAQVYPWMQLFPGQPVQTWRPEALRATAEAGASLWEDFLPEDTAGIQALGRDLVAASVQSLTIYANATLHTAEWPQVVAGLIGRMRAAQQIGVKILVVNPSPLSWSSLEDKTDDQLRQQALAMSHLGEGLARQDQSLAYHTHHMEMRQAAREFHHTLLATDSELVGLCLDAHWIYRGAGNSEVALQDIVRLYGFRIHTYHLRQSHQGIWSEAFGPGDIDYHALAAMLPESRFTAPLIIEQAIEQGTPKTTEPVESLSQGINYISQVFGS